MIASLPVSIKTPSGILPDPTSVSSNPLPLRCPLFEHKVAAGFPSPATEYLESSLDLNEFLVRHKAASFFFSVVGDSMEDAGILDGDKVLVDRSIQPRDGHVVIAVIDSEYTLKRLSMQSGRVELRPENKRYKPICINEEQQLEIWGVVVGVIRKLRV